jgi:DNA-binding NtrC family response regulator
MLTMTLCTKDEPERRAPSALYESSGEPIIFVVEDDFRIRHLIGTLLRRLTPAAVSEAADPHAALLMARDIGSRVDLLISDIDLRASIDGVDLARALAKVNPSMQVLLMSAVERPLFGIPKTWRFLAKPFTLESFLASIGPLCWPAIEGLGNWGTNDFVRGLALNRS